MTDRRAYMIILAQISILLSNRPKCSPVKVTEWSLIAIGQFFPLVICQAMYMFDKIKMREDNV